MASDRSTYFPSGVLDPIFSDEPVPVPVFKEVYVGIDPASHNSSSMGLSAIGVKDGTIFMLGLASVKIERADVREISQSITLFLQRLREHPAIGKKCYFLPIVEVNGNVSVLVGSIPRQGLIPVLGTVRSESCEFVCRVPSLPQSVCSGCVQHACVCGRGRMDDSGDQILQCQDTS